jgi:hypothetical protein
MLELQLADDYRRDRAESFSSALKSSRRLNRLYSFSVDRLEAGSLRIGQGQCGDSEGACHLSMPITSLLREIEKSHLGHHHAGGV